MPAPMDLTPEEARRFEHLFESMPLEKLRELRRLLVLVLVRKRLAQRRERP